MGIEAALREREPDRWSDRPCVTTARGTGGRDQDQGTAVALEEPRRRRTECAIKTVRRTSGRRRVGGGVTPPPLRSARATDTRSSARPADSAGGVDPAEARTQAPRRPGRAVEMAAGLPSQIDEVASRKLMELRVGSEPSGATRGPRASDGLGVREPARLAPPEVVRSERGRIQHRGRDEGAGRGPGRPRARTRVRSRHATQRQDGLDEAPSESRVPPRRVAGREGASGSKQSSIRCART